VVEVARDTPDQRFRVGYAAQALVFLDRTIHQAQQCNEVAQGSPEQAEVMALAQIAKVEVESLLPV
jgi:hypothetical protein